MELLRIQTEDMPTDTCVSLEFMSSLQLCLRSGIYDICNT